MRCWPSMVLASILLIPSLARPAEPWADPAAPAIPGLLLWLDASRQPAAWQTAGKGALLSGQALDTCYDASGQRVHLRQLVANAQPRFVAAQGRAALRFDGQDDWLGARGPGRALDQLTLFVVAAPRSNTGGYRGLFSGQEYGKNDYVTGLNVDLTADSSARLDRLNIEGRGFGGARNLLTTSLPFGEFRTLEVNVRGQDRQVELLVDGQAAGRRPREAVPLRLDEVQVGARCYSNDPRPPFVSGHFDGDIAEILLFDRALDPQELTRVRAYLGKKHAGLARDLVGSVGQPFRPVDNPPPVQVLVPGFAARTLPLDLPNINNVRYRPDGKALALAYNGDIYLLSDTDGDGLEDRAELYWDNQGRLRAPIGMALTPPGYRHGTGVFVASKGKLSLLVEEGPGGRATREIVVARGWPELGHGVDALGVAVDREGQVYFGLGAADFTNPYLVDPAGKGRYSLTSERGTILKVSPDFSQRSILATGIRFSVGLAFNRHGDLFATDQEGATWLANGNPLDELLQIVPGRHYGFPPRHPRHLPTVIDEPSVFDYGPQHQSTCGLTFNNPAGQDPPFGPASWNGDALVTGYSRGKLWRTQLVRTPAGYVACNHLLACTQMLAVDACPSPRGDLLIATHGGVPDWGSGPTGHGKLFKLIYRDRELPQPSLVWPAGPAEVRVAFDRPLDPMILRGLAEKARIEFGPFVAAGDRFETLRPGYATVQQQLSAPRREVPVHGVQITPDRRTLVVSTAPDTTAVPHALTLPGLGRPGKTEPADLPQHSQVDLAYDVDGVEVRWQQADNGPSWTGWWPHVDPVVSREFTRGSADHDNAHTAILQAGRLVLRSRIDLRNMLRPEVQPGSRLDHQLPPEQVRLLLESSSPLSVSCASASQEKAAASEGLHAIRLSFKPGSQELVPLDISLDKPAGPLRLHISFSTAEDDRPRPLPLRRFLLPWATGSMPQGPAGPMARPELDGGSWARGRELFFGPLAQCSLCHSVRGLGARVGPDLTNLPHRDYQSVLRDIRSPSATINPDFLTYLVELKDGRTLTGTVRDTGEDRIIVGDSQGRETSLSRKQLESMTPAPLSLMPQGIDELLGPERLRDLLTFLLTEPLLPAPLERDGAPPPRKRAEVASLLGPTVAPAASRRRLHVVLAGGPKDHGPGEHDYPLFQRRWFNLLSLADGVSVDLAGGWPSPSQWRRADLVVFYSNNPGWTAEKARDLDAFLARGGGLAFIHYAVDGHDAVPALADRIGLAWQGGRSKFRHGPLALTFPGKPHPVTRGLKPLNLVDESYWNLVGDAKRIQVLAQGDEEAAAQPLLWAREQGGGRVFVCIPGHYTWTFDDPVFRLVLLRGMAWAAREPADRFQDLALIGARVED